MRFMPAATRVMLDAMLIVDARYATLVDGYATRLRATLICAAVPAVAEDVVTTE